MTTRWRALRDLADNGPRCLSSMREEIGGYAYPCVYKMQAEGLVDYSERMKCYVITDKGREALRRHEGAGQ